MEERPINGVGMLLVTLSLMATVLVLAFLAGPFGRTPTIRQTPNPYSAAYVR